jgi:hypothetical protein
MLARGREYLAAARGGRVAAPVAPPVGRVAPDLIDSYDRMLVDINRRLDEQAASVVPSPWSRAEADVFMSEPLGAPRRVPAPSVPSFNSLVTIKSGAHGASEAADAALGINTKSTAASAALRLGLGDAIAELLPSWRITFCGKAPIPPDEGDPLLVKVLRHVESGRSSFGGLARCGSVWVCPSCAARIGEQRRAELELAIERWRSVGGVVYLATYTFRHKRKDRLSDLVASFGSAQASMTGSRDYRSIRADYGIQHSIKALEVTYGDRNGWHVHSHWLLFGDGVLYAGGVDELRAAIYGAWSAAAGRKGLETTAAYGVDIQATSGAIGDYIAKWGHDPSENVRPWGAADELAKSASKVAKGGVRYTPWDLARQFQRSRSEHFAELFVEYALHFHGKRQLVWSRGAKLALLGVADEVLTDEQEAAQLLAADLHPELETVASLFEYEWLAVLHKPDGRATLLGIASSGDRAAVRSYVASLVMAAEKEGYSPVLRAHLDYLRLFTDAVT